jgi:NitT/TauT family transport system permease protein
MIVRASAFMDMTLMFSGLVAAAIVALIFNGAMSMIGQWLMPWSRH